LVSEDHDESDMKTNLKMTLAVLAGVAMGTAGAEAIRAQQVKMAPGYVIAEVEQDPAKTQDPTASQKYRDDVPKTLIPFGGRSLVASRKVETVEGEASNGFIVVIAFDSLEKARGWYSSPAYRAIKPIRQNSTKSRVLIIEGIAAN
jgi:uncharacterized protein (DUF1330 family)